MLVDHGVVAFTEYGGGCLRVRTVEVLVQRVVSPRCSFDTFLSGDLEPLVFAYTETLGCFHHGVVEFGRTAQIWQRILSWSRKFLALLKSVVILMQLGPD